MVSPEIANECKGDHTDSVVDAALDPFCTTKPILVDGVGPAREPSSGIPQGFVTITRRKRGIREGVPYTCLPEISWSQRHD